MAPLLLSELLCLTQQSLRFNYKCTDVAGSRDVYPNIPVFPSDYSRNILNSSTFLLFLNHSGNNSCRPIHQQVMKLVMGRIRAGGNKTLYFTCNMVQFRILPVQIGSNLHKNDSSIALVFMSTSPSFQSGLYKNDDITTKLTMQCAGSPVEQRTQP